MKRTALCCFTILACALGAFANDEPLGSAPPTAETTSATSLQPSEGKNGPTTTVEVKLDPFMKYLMPLLVERETLMETVGANHPQVRKLDKRIEALKSMLHEAAAPPDAPVRPARFLHYVSHGQRAMPVFTTLMEELWKKDVVLSVGRPGEPLADQLRIEVTINETTDWKTPVVALLKEISELPVRPMALSCGHSQGNEPTNVKLQFGAGASVEERQAVEVVLKRHPLPFTLHRLAANDAPPAPPVAEAAAPAVGGVATSVPNLPQGQSPGPAAADSAAITAALPSTAPVANSATRKKRFIVYLAEGTRLSEFLQQWIESGLVERQVEPTSEQPMPRDRLTITNGSSSNGDLLTPPLKEIAALELPTIALSFSSDSFSISRFASPPPSLSRELSARSRQLSARLTLSPDTGGNAGRQISEILTKAGIPTVTLREPTLSLWLIKSDFSGIPTQSVGDLKKVLKEIGLPNENVDAAPNIGTELLFPKDVGIVFTTAKAASVLSWLRTQNMVIEATQASPDNPDHLSRPVTLGDAGGSPAGQPFAKRTAAWSWFAAAPEPADIDIRRLFAESVLWRGELQPRNPTTLFRVTTRVHVEPGHVAIVNAFPVVANSNGGSAYDLPIRLAQKHSYFPLIVVENHRIEDRPSSLSTGDQPRPQLFAPDAAAPLTTVGPDSFGQGMKPDAMQIMEPFVNTPALEKQPTASTALGPAPSPPATPLTALPSTPGSRNVPELTSSEAQASRQAANQEALSKPKLYVDVDGSGASESDRAKLEELIAEGVLERRKTTPDSPPPTIQLMLQPRLSATDVDSAGGGFSPSETVKAALVNPAWIDAIRTLKNAPVGGPIALSFHSHSAAWPAGRLIPDVDARLITPVENATTITKVVVDAFRAHSMKVASLQAHPYFGAIPIPDGKELYPVYIDESRSAQNMFNNTDDLVDIQFTVDDAAPLASRRFTVLERLKVLTYRQAFGTPLGAQGHLKVLGVIIDPQEGDLLRAAERRGRLEALRRDPNDHQTRVTEESRKQLDAFLTSAQAQSPSPFESDQPLPRPRMDTKTFQSADADVAGIVKLLREVIKTGDFVAAADERTNTIVMRSSDPETLNFASILIEKLTPPPAGTSVVPKPTSRRSPGALGDAKTTSERALTPQENFQNSITNTLFGSPKPSPPSPKAAGDLARSYAEREAAAAKLARELRDFTAAHQAHEKPATITAEESRLKKALSDAVTKAFEARQALLTVELEAMQSRIASTQRSIELRNKAAEEIVARRVADLLDPQFRWDENPVASQQQPATYAGESPGDLKGPVTVPAGAGTKRTPRVLSAGTVDPGRLLGAIVGIGESGGVSSSVGGNTIHVKATDEEWDRIRVLVDDEKNRSAEEAEKKRLREDEDRKVWVVAALEGIWEESGTASFGDVVPEGPRPTLVIHDGKAALFAKNERQRLWTISVETFAESRAAPLRLKLTAMDGGTSLQGSRESGSPDLNTVAVGTSGVEIRHYSKAIAAVPLEWAAEMAKPATSQTAVVAPEKLDDSTLPSTPGSAKPRVDLSNAPPRGSDEQADDLPRSRVPLNRLRQPSDYLDLVQKHRDLLQTGERGMKSLGPDHPEVKGFREAVEQAGKTLELLQAEYSAQMKEADSDLQVTQAELNAARRQFERASELVKNRAISAAEADKLEVGMKTAEAQLQSAKSRLELFESSRKTLFPDKAEDSGRKDPTKIPAESPGVGGTPNA